MSINKASGNVLVFILIAIFLMGALTMLFVRSDGQSEDTGDYERSSIRASRLIDHSVKIKNAVDRLKIQGCSENEISLWQDTNGDGLETSADRYYNTAAPPDKSCHVYSTQGGGLTPFNLADFDSFHVQRVVDVGTSDNDLFFIADKEYEGAPRGLGDDTCAAINRMAGNGYDSANLPRGGISVGAYNNAFTGTEILGNTGTETPMAGIKMGCAVDIGCGSGVCNVFYSVIMIR